MLVQKMPLPSGEWNVVQLPKEKDDTLETRWMSTTMSDMAQTIVTYDAHNADLYSLKNEDDGKGKKACTGGFSSKVLSEGRQNGYPQLTWRSLCRTASGYTALVLHKSIAGNQALYRFRRTFPAIPSRPEWLLWIKYSRAFSVCDTSQPLLHPCPADMATTES
ncbi:hypothetical protein [Alteromonas ponticola]|uniref:Uncharacterized protein n=1 Tax=Alteromonas ponticola TaxID=2720613 RepID=A0ABX1R5F4_9ALTE|nr:hypothetical protein [Alteromonas ponticola]NMH60726.1 hypothetical protein [Alteromonas ponticola]